MEEKKYFKGNYNYEVNIKVSKYFKAEVKKEDEFTGEYKNPEIEEDTIVKK